MYLKLEKFDQYTSDLLSQWEKGLLGAIYCDWRLFQWKDDPYHQLIKMAIVESGVRFVYLPLRRKVSALTTEDRSLFELEMGEWTQIFIGGLVSSFEGIDVFVDEDGKNLYSHIRYPILLSRTRVEELEKMCVERGLSLPAKKTRQTLRQTLLA